QQRRDSALEGALRRRQRERAVEAAVISTRMPQRRFSLPEAGSRGRLSIEQAAVGRTMGQIPSFNRTNADCIRGTSNWLSAFECSLAAQRLTSMSSTAFETFRWLT